MLKVKTVQLVIGNGFVIEAMNQPPAYWLRL